MSAHESLVDSGEIAGPSNRKFGLTLGAVLIVLAAVRWHAGSGALVVGALAGCGGVLVILGAVAPGLLTWPNRAWLRLGVVLAAVMTPLVMLVIFALVFVPLALLMRLRDRDQLALRRKPASGSYWVERQPPGPAPATMIHQF